MGLQRSAGGTWHAVVFLESTMVCFLNMIPQPWHLLVWLLERMNCMTDLLESLIVVSKNTNPDLLCMQIVSKQLSCTHQEVLKTLLSFIPTKMVHTGVKLFET